MLDELSREQLMAMPNISPEAFLYIIQACERGVESGDTLICAHACSSIYNMCSFVVRETEKAERDAHTTTEVLARRRSSVASGNQTMGGNHWLIQYFRQFTQALPTLLASVFSLILFEDNSDQWSLSRPLYGLMLLQKEYSVKYIDAVINQQLPERQAFVATVSSEFLLGL